MKLFVSISLGLLFVSATKAQDIAFKIVNTFHITSPGGWDYIALNKGRIYVSHSTQVNILDEKTGDSLGFIPNTTGVHGIAFDNELNRGYTSNGRLNSVSVFDLKTNEVLAQIPTGENPDAIMFEPFTKKIITNNGRGKNLSVIDPATNTVIAAIDVGGKPEEAASDKEGRLYVNVEDKNEIVVVDLKAYKVIAHWALAPGIAPTGLAIDRKTKRLFSTCSDSRQLIILDATNGILLDKLPIGEGCDGIAFDPELKTLFTSNGEGTITIIKENGHGEFKVAGSLPTKRSARTITIDAATHTLFLPAADFEAPEPNAAPNARRKMIPGSFQVLVIR